MRTVVVVVLAVLLLLPAFASNPGEPLDCSDWVFLEPGLYCEELGSIDGTVFWRRGSSLQTDNLGRLLTIDTPATPGHVIEQWSHPSVPLTLEVFNGQVSSIIARIDDRVGIGGYFDHIRPTKPTCEEWDNCTQQDNKIGFTIAFDAVEGRLLIPVTSYCKSSCVQCEDCPNYNRVTRVIAIGGFTRLFDVFQTYTPSSSSLNFRVPPIPEGFSAADWFDTYYGTLASVGDWSQAQPLQCAYPPASPSVGDYLTVADTLPTPPTNQGYYYVTAATYQGQTRYGRKATGGVLSGRDPAVLPACE